MESSEINLVREIPSSLKQLARLVVRGFYNVEDTLIIDMLVRNPCMKEDDICDLLKFERKMLRSRIATLIKDRFIQTRIKMETSSDGKSQRQNYYFINYKADQLFDSMTSEFRCTFCKSLVEEDESALPKQDSRLLLARFNEQMEALYILLREVEDIKLAPEVLEPEPVSSTENIGKQGVWSGEATRNQNPLDHAPIQVSLGNELDAPAVVKETPVWMMESTIVDSMTPSLNSQPYLPVSTEKEFQKTSSQSSEDIMSVLLALEKKQDSESIQPLIKMEENIALEAAMPEVDLMDSEDEEVVPLVHVGDMRIPITEVTDEIIGQMSANEKDAYINLYQDYYANEFD